MVPQDRQSLGEFGAVPLDAQDALNTLMQGGLGELIQFGMLLLAVGLLVGAIFMAGLAGTAFMSQNPSKQNSVSTYAIAAIGMVACALIVGVGPSVLQALGIEVMQYISPIEVFAGGGGN